VSTTFRDALDREIQNQGLSVAEVADASGVSRGAIYNILNGKTEEARIRPATRRALARGCNRDLEVGSDGSIHFVEAGTSYESAQKASLEVQFLADRPFLKNHLFREPFDWLHSQAESGILSGVQVVDRVFQGRDEFVSVQVVNRGMQPIRELSFDLNVGYPDGPSDTFSYRFPASLDYGDAVEHTVFLMAGPPYSLEVTNAAFTDEAGETHSLRDRFRFDYEGRQRD
jgi:transcriptional regulator with XRE-family HTH domain